MASLVDLPELDTLGFLLLIAALLLGWAALRVALLRGSPGESQAAPRTPNWLAALAGQRHAQVLLWLACLACAAAVVLRTL